MNILLAPAIALVAAITVSTPAQADEADDHYLQLLPARARSSTVWAIV
jgi:hypothetical protein